MASYREDEAAETYLHQEYGYRGLGRTLCIMQLPDPFALPLAPRKCGVMYGYVTGLNSIPG